MCLNVYAGGNGNGKGTHVSVYLYLMKGPYDDKLGHWPLRGMFKAELLSQVNDGKYTDFIPFDIHVPSKHTDRVTKRDIAPAGWGKYTDVS